MNPFCICLQTGTAAFVLNSHRNVVQACAFSVDSSTVVSYCRETGALLLVSQCDHFEIYMIAMIAYC